MHFILPVIWEFEQFSKLEIGFDSNGLRRSIWNEISHVENSWFHMKKLLVLIAMFPACEWVFHITKIQNSRHCFQTWCFFFFLLIRPARNLAHKTPLAKVFDFFFHISLSLKWQCFAVVIDLHQSFNLPNFSVFFSHSLGNILGGF